MSAPKFTRLVEMHGAYDKRATGHGIHGMDLRFILKGEDGAVQFVVYTNIQLDHVATEQWERARMRHDDIELRCFWRPMGVDIGYHAREPQYDGQDHAQGSCPYLDGAPCYYGGSSLRAEEFMPTFIAGGSDAVWKMLEDRYEQTFGKDAALAKALPQ